MSLRDWLRRPTPTVPLPQLCYDVAYFALPSVVFGDLGGLIRLCRNDPVGAGPTFYRMAADARQVKPRPEDGRLFRWHQGALTTNRAFLALEYPEPPPIDLSDIDPKRLIDGPDKFVLAPHFSAIVIGSGLPPQYFVLGQAPMGGGTTLRTILPEGINSNLGPGPESRLPAFLDALRPRFTEPTAADSD